MKYLILGILAFIGGMLIKPVLAGYVQDLAWQQKISDGQGGSGAEIYRIEWYGDVCYLANYGITVNGTAMSCIKK